MTTQPQTTADSEQNQSEATAGHPETAAEPTSAPLDRSSAEWRRQFGALNSPSRSEDTQPRPGTTPGRGIVPPSATVVKVPEKKSFGSFIAGALALLGVGAIIAYGYLPSRQIEKPKSADSKPNQTAAAPRSTVKKLPNTIKKAPARAIKPAVSPTVARSVAAKSVTTPKPVAIPSKAPSKPAAVATRVKPRPTSKLVVAKPKPSPRPAVQAALLPSPRPSQTPNARKATPKSQRVTPKPAATTAPPKVPASGTPAAAPTVVVPKATPVAPPVQPRPENTVPDGTNPLGIPR